MRRRATVFALACAVVALQALFPGASRASDGGDPEAPVEQEGENRWVPSLAITSGVTIQKQLGSADSFLFENLSPTSVPLRGFVKRDDLAVSPFVGASLELMTPALPIPTRPRLFLSGEILPTFASDRALGLEGDPDCVRGPEPDAECARIERAKPVVRGKAFGQDAANGQGTEATVRVDTLVFGASLGVAFPLEVGERPLRIKPSFGWIHYEVEAEGLVVDAACDPVGQCTDTTAVAGSELRETILSANGSQSFNGIGPGLDVEMDVGRYGPLGVALFLGGRAYRILGDRTISYGTTVPFSDALGTNDVAEAQFGVEVKPWMFRGHAGIRFQWLGSRE